MSEMPLNLKTIIFREDEVFVETKDFSRFVDVDPLKNQNGVDFYILGETDKGERPPAQAVLLQNATLPLARTHAARMSTSIRTEMASSEEAINAQFFFMRGKALAEHSLQEFVEAVQHDRINNINVTLPEGGLPANNALAMVVEFKNE